MTAVIDPLGGSYYVEALTTEIEAEILDDPRQGRRARWDDEGHREDYFQREIADFAYDSRGARPRASSR